MKSQSQDMRKMNEYTPSIDKLNRLRDSIVANMVGVISFLQKEYPGIVILEDLKKSSLDKHFEAHNENISRRLEYKLFQKFQTLGLVPPHLKDIIALRDQTHQEQEEKITKAFLKKLPKDKNVEENDTYDKYTKEELEALKKTYDNEYKQVNAKVRKEENFTYQLGAIVFTDEYNTSKNCPYCNGKLDKNPKVLDIEKFQQHRFLCGDRKSFCKFDTYWFVDESLHKTDAECFEEVKPKSLKDVDSFKEINDPDKVAAYNVAKKVTKPGDIKSWTEIEVETKQDIGSSGKREEKSQNQHSSQTKKKDGKPPINKDSPLTDFFSNYQNKK